MNCPFCNKTLYITLIHESYTTYKCYNHLDTGVYLGFDNSDHSVHYYSLYGKNYNVYVAFKLKVTQIRNSVGASLHYFNYVINFTPENLENKIKTILMFS